MFEEAVDARDANVVEVFDAVAHQAGRKEGFFGNRNVAGAGRDDEDGSLPGDFGAAFDGDDAGELMELRCFGKLADGREDSFVGTRDQNVVARALFSEQRTDDGHYLRWRLSLAEDDFGKALAESAVMVHFREAQVFERKMLQTLDGARGREFPGMHGFQNFQ